MIKHSIVSTALLAIVLALAIACAGSAPSSDQASPPASQPTQSESEHPIDPTAENEFATSMLLTLADFPAGWFHEPDDSDEDEMPNPLDVCFDDEFEGQTGSALGGEFSDANTSRLSINPSVYVFGSADDAQKAVESMLPSIKCMAVLIGDGLELNANVALGRMYYEPISTDVYEATAAIRIYQTLIIQTQERPDTEILVFDLVTIVDGRILYLVEGYQRQTPIDQSLLKLYVDKARAKIRQAP